jgi:hypothetical protein
MKRYQAVLLALMAVLAFAAVTAGAASAETTLLVVWLRGSTEIKEGESFETLTGESLTIGHLSKAKVECSGFFDGTVKGNGTDTVTSVLNLAGVATGAALSGLALVCTGLETCESAEVWPVDLPWNTIAYLMENGTLLDLFLSGGKGNPGYEVNCLVIGIGVEEECTGETSALIENAATGIKGIFNATELEKEKLEATCKGEEQTGFQSGEGTTTLVNGEVLSVTDNN